MSAPSQIDSCRNCGAAGLRSVLDLGRMPLANGLFQEVEAARDAPRFPLAVLGCESCGLFQLGFAPAPDVLFKDYAYKSSVSQHFLDHAARLVGAVRDRFKPSPGALVLEVGSNDGYLLRNYLSGAFDVLGIDPSEDAARHAESVEGVETRCAFFGPDLAEEIARTRGRAAILHANNVMAHIPDIGGFITSVAKVLDREGVAVIEVPYLGDLIEKSLFDTIYHEHIFYFSVRALADAFRRGGMTLFDVERVAIHGGSLRLFAGRSDGPHAEAVLSARVTEMMEAESETLTPGAPAVRAFAARVHRQMADVADAVAVRRATGARLAAYGAAAKGSVLLNALGERVDGAFAYVVDRNDLKQGRYMGGIGLPIVSPQALRDDPPDGIVILPWNIADEIAAELAEHLPPTTEVIVPLPTLRAAPLGRTVADPGAHPETGVG